MGPAKLLQHIHHICPFKEGVLPELLITSDRTLLEQAAHEGTCSSRYPVPGEVGRLVSDARGYSLIPQAAADSELDVSKPVSAHTTASLGPVITCVAIASLGALAFGYHLGVVNGPLAAIAADLGFAKNAALQGTVVSSTLAGAAVGSLTGSSLADNLGRRKAFLLDTIPLALGPLLSATATSLSAMIAGRLIAGVGIGLSSALVPLYISEVAPTEVRGLLGSVNQLVICIGILAALVVNVALPASSWRTMFALAIAPAVVLALGMLVAPESPRWLFSKGRLPEAEAGAQKLWGPAGPGQLTPSAGDTEGGRAPAKSAGLGEALKSKGVILGCTMFVLQQLSGINAIVYYSSSVFAKAGIASGALASAGVGAINVLGTVVAAYLMDRAGRKQLLTLSFTGMGVAMLAMSAGLGLPQFASASGAIALVGTLAYVVSFSLGAGPVPGLLVPEITSTRLRGIAVSAAMVTHWIFNFGIGQLFLPAVTKFGVPAVYLFFTAICFITVAVARSQLVETKGMSLEQIEAAMAA